MKEKHFSTPLIYFSLSVSKGTGRFVGICHISKNACAGFTNTLFKKQNGSRSNSRVQDVCRIYSHSVCTFHRLKFISCSCNLLHCREENFLNKSRGQPLLRNGLRYEDNTKINLTI